MGCNQSVHVHNALVIDNEYMNYVSAGVCFKNETHILGGVQRVKKEKMISGIGGKREKLDESYYHTAFRELLEELFNIKPSLELISLCYSFKPIDVQYFSKNKYIMVSYDFKQLIQLLNMLNKMKLKSPLYAKFPVSLEELLFERIKSECEVTHICLLPLETIKYDRYFIEDIKHIKNNNNNK
jgi:hypothetical protein